MEWIQFFVESYLRLINYLAWPAVVLICFFVLRKPLIGLLRRVSKVGKGDWFAELARDELQKKAAKRVKLSEITEKTLNWDNYLDALEGWAFNLTIKIDGLSRFVVDGKSYLKTKVGMHELKLLQQILQKLEKERPSSKWSEFSGHLLKQGGLL